MLQFNTIYILLVMSIAVVTVQSQQTTSNARLLVDKQILNKYIVEERDVVVNYHILNIGGSTARDVQVTDDTFLPTKFQVINGYTSFSVTELASGTNLTHVVILRPLPNSWGQHMFGPAKVTYKKNDAGDVQIGYSSELGEGYIVATRTFDRKFSSHFFDWFVFAIMCLPSIGIPYYLWSKSNMRFSPSASIGALTLEYSVSPHQVQLNEMNIVIIGIANRDTMSGSQGNSIERQHTFSKTREYRNGSRSASTLQPQQFSLTDLDRDIVNSGHDEEHDDTTHNIVCNRFGFIVDSNDTVSNLRKFPDSGDALESEDKLTRDQAIAKMREREKKWLDMINSWDTWILGRFKRVRSRCRKGIPSAVRGKAWFYLSGGHISLKKYPKLYEKLEHEPGEPQVNDDIRKDIHRQFPNHELFLEPDGPGQQSLFNVLKCFSIVRKEISYCQGLGPIASILLMNMPPSHAFWSLVAICDHYVPGYYLAGFEAVQLHGRMLFALLRKYAPASYKILKKADIDPILYMFEWFMCLFVRNLPWATVLRIWDIFLCEGIVVIFKTAIVIISGVLTSDYKKRDQHEILQSLKNIPEKDLHESVLIPKVLKLDLTDSHLKREHQRQLRKKAKVGGLKEV
ncbi:TBC1 domain family member 10A, partial [Fragariocoptes setiger]